MRHGDLTSGELRLQQQVDHGLLVADACVAVTRLHLHRESLGRAWRRADPGTSGRSS